VNKVKGTETIDMPQDGKATSKNRPGDATDSNFRGSRRKDPKVAPRRKSQAERSELTRTRVIEAASRLIRLRGYSDLSTEEVSRLAGVSRGAQRHHFPTKSDLVLATLRHLNERMLLKARERVVEVKDGRPFIDAVIDDATDFFFGEYFFMILAVGMSDERNRGLRSDVRRLSQESRILIEQGWDRVAEEAGLPKELASDVVALTLSVVRGFGVRSFIRDDPKRFKHLVDLWRKIIQDYVASAMTVKSSDG
jgi:AcrR family transcriptional regulator